MEQARVGNRLAHVGEPTHPGDEALEPHAEAAVREAAVLAHVEVPLERLLGQLVFLDAVQQQIVVVNSKENPPDQSLRGGDRLVSVDTVDVADLQDVTRIIGPHQADDVVRVRILRDGEMLDVDVRLVKPSAQPAQPRRDVNNNSAR